MITARLRPVGWLAGEDLSTVTGSDQPPRPYQPSHARPGPGRPRESAVALRLGLLGQSLLLAVASTAGAYLAAAWICAVVVLGIGAGIPLTLLATVPGAVVRRPAPALGGSPARRAGARAVPAGAGRRVAGADGGDPA